MLAGLFLISGKQHNDIVAGLRLPRLERKRNLETIEDNRKVAFLSNSALEPF